MSNGMGVRTAAARVAAVIPCYQCAGSALDVIARMPNRVDAIFVVDDGCPDDTGAHVAAASDDLRLRVLEHDHNRGVGAATVTGYRAALQDGADIVVKLDGDGQMDPALIPDLIALIEAGEADYCKGNRFYFSDDAQSMPRYRYLGNAGLSFLTKLSSGYWSIFDPTNGFTAIHRSALSLIRLDRLDEGYFFESDMLFRLNIARAVVRDVPLRAVYGGETSHLNAMGAFWRWPWKHLRNTWRRLIYRYYLHDFSLASLEFPIGLFLFGFGLVFGAFEWTVVAQADRSATAGTVMLAALPVILGVQLLLSALHHDIENQPRVPLQQLTLRGGGGSTRRPTGPRRPGGPAAQAEQGHRQRPKDDIPDID